MKYFLPTICALFLCAAPAAGAELKGVAISPFAAKGGADAAMAEGLTALLQQELAGAPCVRIVAEDIVADLARQQGLEQACGTESCQIDLATQAQADFLVRGELARVGTAYALTGYLIDLKTQKTESNERVIVTGDNALVGASIELASKLRPALGCPGDERPAAPAVTPAAKAPAGSPEKPGSLFAALTGARSDEAPAMPEVPERDPHAPSEEAARINGFLAVDSYEFTAWMSDEEDQAVWDLRVKEEKQIAVASEGRLYHGARQWRKKYRPSPNVQLWFYSYRGMTGSDFADKDTRYRAKGYYLTQHQTFSDERSVERHQATWIKLDLSALPPVPDERPAPRHVAMLEIEELKTGFGTAAQAGDAISVHVTATLADGTLIADTRADGKPMKVHLGEDSPDAWNEGVAGMKSGGKRRLYVPVTAEDVAQMMNLPQLASGAAPRPVADAILERQNTGASLTYEIELLGVVRSAPESRVSERR